MPYIIEKVPERFKAVSILGDLRTAICYVAGKIYIIGLDYKGNLERAHQAWPQDNVNMTLQASQDMQEVYDASYQTVLEKLHHRTKQFAPLIPLYAALDNDLPIDSRIKAAILADEAMTDENKAFVRVRLLSGYLPDAAHPDSTISIARARNCIRLIPVLEELKEALPELINVLNVFVNLSKSLQTKTSLDLWERGIVAEAALGLARMDLNGLDKLIETASTDKNFLKSDPNIKAVLTVYGRWVRDISLSGGKIAGITPVPRG